MSHARSDPEMLDSTHEPAAKAGIVRFGACEMRIAGRELRCHGIVQRLPPQAFELLHYFVRNPDRVLRPEELIERVWRGADVSDNVIARAVMKLRRAIDDNSADPQLLRTVHRVGYRFTASLVFDAGLSEPTPEPEVHRVFHAPRTSVAVLPIENMSGDKTLDWIVRGLPILVAQALETDPRLLVTAPSTVQHVLALFPARAAELIGAATVVRGVLRRSGGNLVLGYHALGEQPFRGSLRAVEPSDLGQALAAAIEAGMFPDARSPVRFQSADPFANQAYARALDLYNHEQWGPAARLLRVVLDLAPNDLHARLHYVRMMANYDAPQGVIEGCALLRDAELSGNQRLLGAAHEALSRAYYNARATDAAERYRHHLDRALELAEPFEGEDWVVRIQVGLAMSAHLRRDLPLARKHYERAWSGNEQAGNQIRRASILNNQAVLATNDGDLVLAREMVETSLQISTRFGLKGNAVAARSNLVLVLSHLGLLSAAVETWQAAMADMPGLLPSEIDVKLWAVVIGAELAWLSGRKDVFEQAYASSADFVDLPPRAAMLWAMACAFREARGAPERARPLVLQALAAAEEQGYVDNLHEFLRRAIDMWLVMGRLDELGEWEARARALERVDDDPMLQATLLRVQAARAVRRGSVEEACDWLEQAIARAPASAPAGLSRLDLAWLQCQAGRTHDARHTLRGAGNWLHEHPRGPLLAAALMQFELPPESLSTLLTLT